MQVNNINVIQNTYKYQSIKYQIINDEWVLRRTNTVNVIWQLFSFTACNREKKRTLKESPKQQNRKCSRLGLINGFGAFVRNRNG